MHQSWIMVSTNWDISSTCLSIISPPPCCRMTANTLAYRETSSHLSGLWKIIWLWTSWRVSNDMKKYHIQIKRKKSNTNSHGKGFHRHLYKLSMSPAPSLYCDVPKLDQLLCDHFFLKHHVAKPIIYLLNINYTYIWPISYLPIAIWRFCVDFIFLGHNTFCYPISLDTSLNI